MLLDLTQLQSLQEPARAWRWRVMMPDLIAGGFSRDLLVENVSFPNHTVNQTQRQVGGSYMHYPDFKNINSLGLTLYEDENYTSTNYLASWKDLVVDDTNQFGLPVDYKKSIVLTLYGLESNISPMLTLQLDGCWPMAQHSFDLAYTDSGFITVAADFSVDKSTIVQSSDKFRNLTFGGILTSLARLFQ